jgi:o-succinylbenzoate synthase
MRVERIEQFHLQMRLKHHFETSFSRVTVMDKVITAVYADGLVGYGESPVDTEPFYSYENIETCWHIQHDFLIPMLLGKEIQHATDVPALLARVRGHSMAKAGLEAAIWDLDAQMQGISVSALLGGTRDRIASGVSIGIQDTLEELLEQIETYLAEGYVRIKIKIKPGWDATVVQAVRARFPETPLMVDANSAYALADAPMLKALDGYNLLMIEQPLAYDDILEHAELQNQLDTRICLDESITSVGRAREALALQSCRIINIKPARVGGWTNARAIHDLCMAANIPVWCGGMLESGIGRAHNIALASLPNFTLPGDISASDRYWQQDIIEPEFALNPDGTISVPTAPGIGVTVMRDRLEAAAVRKADHRAG